MLDSKNIDYERIWFQGICSASELERIMNVQNGKDFILRMRAETIADNVRLFRVFNHIIRSYKNNGQEWALEKYFVAYNYIDVLHHLDKEKEELCRQVSFGSIISNEPNGQLFETPYGICSTCSTVLREFSLYSCLALFSLGDKVPPNVRMQAMRIAIRIMLQKESLDFEVDPRGIIPKGILNIINPIYPQQITFIAAHEYSHLINGDLQKGDTVKRAVLKAHFKDEVDYKMINVYNTNQKQEFKADVDAMIYPAWEKKWYCSIYFSAMIWFASLAIYEAAENTMFPPIGFQSHPGAKARYQNLLENAPRPIDFDKELYYKTIPELVSIWEDIIKEDVSSNFDIYEMYGSLYLDKPNSKWRGRELIDRVDY